MILALAADVEGEATTNYLVELLKPFGVAYAHRAWVARGRRLESADELGFYQALSGRRQI